MATEVKQRNNRVFVIIGVLVAAGAFALSLYLSNRNSGGGGSGAPQVSAVYTKQAIPKGTRIDASMLTTKTVASDSLPEGFLSDASTVTSQFATIDLASNSPIYPSEVISNQAVAQTTGLTQAPLDIAKGDVALALPTSPQSGPDYSADLVTTGQFIHDGDHIDIMITAGNSVRYAYQNVRVLHVGTSAATTTSGTAANATVIVVEVPRAIAEELVLLTTHQDPGHFVVRYVLRSSKDVPNPTGTLDNPLSSGSTDPNAGKPAPQDAPVDPTVVDRLFPAR